MQKFEIFRFAVFGVLLLFSLIVLGLSANFISQAPSWSIPGFALAVSVITFAIVIPMMVVDFLRKGAVVTWVAVELGWVGLLWVLWVAAAGNSTSNIIFAAECSLLPDDYASICHQYSAMQAFLWLSWLVIFFYMIVVIILALMAYTRGNTRAWLGPTSNLSFNPPRVNGGEPKVQNTYPVQQSYPMNHAGQPGGYAGSHPASPATGYVQPNQYGSPYNPNAAHV